MASEKHSPRLDWLDALTVSDLKNKNKISAVKGKVQFEAYLNS